MARAAKKLVPGTHKDKRLGPMDRIQGRRGDEGHDSVTWLSTGEMTSVKARQEHDGLYPDW